MTVRGLIRVRRASPAVHPGDGPSGRLDAESGHLGTSKVWEIRDTLLGLTLAPATTSIASSFHTVADTRSGGGILWVASELFTFAAIGLVVYQWMRSDTREAERGDRRAEAARTTVQGAEPELAGVGTDRELTEVEVVDGRFVNVSRPGRAGPAADSSERRVQTAPLCPFLRHIGATMAGCRAFK